MRRSSKRGKQCPGNRKVTALFLSSILASGLFWIVDRRKSFSGFSVQCIVNISMCLDSERLLFTFLDGFDANTSFR